MVCIDDFAIRKGIKYATVIIDMINSRDYEEVTSWLKQFPNLQIVSRDGSLTYKKAITDSHLNYYAINIQMYIGF